jgi:hypothetical protein
MGFNYDFLLIGGVCVLSVITFGTPRLARLTMRREVRGRQGNTTWFARHITFQGHRLQGVGIIMLDVFQC